MYEYTLDPSPKKFKCPKCGNKTFVKYVDSSGNYLPDEYGRCDREVECTYFLNPYKEGFADGQNQLFATQAQVIKEPTYHDATLVTRSCAGECTHHLKTFLLEQFDYHAVTDALKAYYVGKSRHWDGATVFWQLDTHHRARGGKVMLYDPFTGKRHKDKQTWAHAVLKTPDFHLSQVPFGSHLIATDTDKAIGIVESEKTAIICSIIVPAMLWLATGGLSNLTNALANLYQDNKTALFNRNVILYPDNGAEYNWEQKAKYLSAIYPNTDWTVSDLCSKGDKGWDLADIILSDAHQHLIADIPKTPIKRPAPAPSVPKLPDKQPSPSPAPTKKTEKEEKSIRRIITWFTDRNKAIDLKDTQWIVIAKHLVSVFEFHLAVELFDLLRRTAYDEPSQFAILDVELKKNLNTNFKGNIGSVISIIKKGGYLPGRPSVHSFWFRNEDNKLVLDPTSVVDFIRTMGFFQWSPDGWDNFDFVYQTGNIIRPVSTERIKAEVNKKVEGISREAKNKLDVHASKLLSNTMLQQLPELDVKLLHSAPEYGYLFFQNACLKIEKDVSEIETTPLEDVDGMIWSKQIIKHDFQLLEIDEAMESVFFDFINLIMDKDDDRVSDLIRTIGYLIHDYKDKINAKAVILMDEKIPLFGKRSDGRTGKGLLMESVAQMTNVLKANEIGKLGSFAWEMIKPDTKVYFFDETRPDFDFQQLFSIITTDLTIDIKNVRKYVIPFAHTPKFTIATNYSIPAETSGDRGRQKVIELAPFFSEKYSPYDHFKHRFFDGWDAKEWNRFYNLMIYALGTYLDDGLGNTKIKNQNARKLIQACGKPFADFALTIQVNREYTYRELAERFNKEKAEELEKEIAPRKMIYYVRDKLARIFNYQVNERTNESGVKCFTLIPNDSNNTHLNIKP